MTRFILRSRISILPICCVFLAFICFISYSQKSFAFVVSNEISCGGGVYQYSFADVQYSNPPSSSEINIEVSSYVSNPDLRIRIVTDPKDADLFLVDGYQNADMAVCFSSELNFQSSHLITEININKWNQQPEVRVRVSAEESAPDHFLFIQSGSIDSEQAAAFFGVLWQKSKSSENSQVQEDKRRLEELRQLRDAQEWENTKNQHYRMRDESLRSMQRMQELMLK